MKDISIFGTSSIPPLPPLPSPLAEALAVGVAKLPKRERTQRQLIQAAIQVFCARGVAGATIQEIATVAGMTNGTVYNYFSTKDEVVAAVALLLADTLCRRISESYEHIREGAERTVIGIRRYIGLAEQSPLWALLLLDVAAAAPDLLLHIRDYALTDLRMGVRQKQFRIVSEAAAMDLINGTVAQAMRSVAYGQTPAGHSEAVATMVLRGLGMPSDEAKAVAHRPLPDFPPVGHIAPRASAARRTKAAV
jgi:AcrR family transcriptional regulator